MDDPNDRALWNAALDARGLEAVRLLLAQAAPTPEAPVRLSLAGLADPSRRHVERWLERKEAQLRAARLRRTRAMLAAALATVAVGAALDLTIGRGWFPH